MPSRRKASKEKETKTKEDDGSTLEVLTPAMLKELLNKMTGGFGHQDSLIAIDRLGIGEILILKRRIAQFDIQASMDLLSREITHINNRADTFTDAADTAGDTHNKEVGLKILFEEMRESKSNIKEEMKEIRGVLKKFSEETAESMIVGKELSDIHTGRTFNIVKCEKFENLEIGIAEEIYKNDAKLKPRKVVIITNDWQVPFSLLRLTIRIKESKDKNRKDQVHAIIRHMETPQALRKFSHDLERILLDQPMIFQSTTYIPLKLNVNRLASFQFNEMPSGFTLCVISLT